MGDRTAMVTGASTGIGRSLACALVADGFRVTAVARREQLLQELVRELGAGHRYLVADLSTTEGIAKTADDLRSTRFNLLVNNAGYGIRGIFHEIPLEDHQRMMRVNCEALTALSYAFLRQASRGDALLNMSSTLGLLAMPSYPVYPATKAFIVSLSEGLWYQYKDQGIYVGALCPGPTHTPFLAIAAGDAKPPDSITQTPEQVVAAAMKALKRRSRPIELTGGKNPLMVFMRRLLSRKRLVNLMGSIDSVKAQ